jgi:hypothetical protein
MAGYWAYIDVTKDGEAYNLKQLLGMAFLSAVFGPILVGFFYHDKHKGQITEFFNKPIIGGKK